MNHIFELSQSEAEVADQNEHYFVLIYRHLECEKTNCDEISQKRSLTENEPEKQLMTALTPPLSDLECGSAKKGFYRFSVRAH